MADITYALTTYAKLKERLEIASATTTFDTMLKRFAYMVTDFIEVETNRRFERTTYTQELYDGSFQDGTQKDTLVLKNAPLTTLTLIEYRTGLKSSPTWVTLSSDNYQENSNGVIKMLGGSFPAGLQNIRVTYVAGYLIDFGFEYDRTKHTVPFEITDLVERLAVRKFKKRNAEGKASEALDGGTITWKEYMDEHDRNVIANYRRTNFL